jgi:hypothetical protein
MYRPWTPEVPDFLLERPSAEGTRLALEPELRGASGLMSLMDGAFRWMEQAGIETLVTSAQVPQPAGHFLQLGLKRAPVEAFVFGPTDRRPSFLLYITVAEARRIIDGYLGAHDAAA